MKDQNLSRKEHQERKNEVRKLLENSAVFFEQAEQQGKAESLRSLSKDVESGTFSIVVVGEFSAGKSTFLNALMGDKYLPAFIDETTATVNFLKHKDLAYQGNEVAVHFTDPSKEIEYHRVADLETMKKLVTTKGINVVTDIKYVEVYLDSPFLKDGVTLVDSPGLNGMAEGHRNITEQQIEQSHASIFMFSATQPGAKSNFDAVRDVQNKLDTVFFILNKIDVINPQNGDSVDGVIETVKRNYAKTFPGKEIPEIWPISSELALAARSPQEIKINGKVNHSKEDKDCHLEKSGIKHFEDRLLQFLTKGEKTKQELLSPVVRVGNLLTSHKLHLTHTIEELSSTFDGDELKNQVVELQTEIARITEKVQNEHGHIKEELHTIEEDVKTAMNAALIRKKDEITSNNISEVNDLASIFEFHESEIPNMKSAYEGIANRMLRQFDGEVKNLLTKHARENFDEIEKALEDKIASTGIKIHLDSLLKPEKYEFQAGLEQFDEEKEKLESEIKKLRNQRDQAEEASQQKTLLEKRIARTEGKIREIDTTRSNLEGIYGRRPDVSYRTKKVHETRSRGVLLDLIIGEERVETEVPVEDRSERNEYDQRVAEAKSKWNDDEAALKKQLAEYEKHHDSLTMEENKLKRQKILEQLQAVEGKREELSEQKRKLITEKTRKAVRKFQSDVQDHIEELEEFVENEFKRKIRDTQKIYIELLEKELTSSSKNILKKCQEEMELKQQLLSSSVEEKTQKITSCKETIAQIDALIENEYSKVKAELEAMTVDQIKLEAL